MVLLQAAIGGSLVLFMVSGLFLLIGIPVLTTTLMKLYWRLAGKKNGNKNGNAFHKDILPFVSILVFTVTALLLVLYMLIILFDNFFPAYSFSN